MTLKIAVKRDHWIIDLTGETSPTCASLQGAKNGRGVGLVRRLCFLLYPFKDVRVVALGELSGKQLNPEACEYQH